MSPLTLAATVCAVDRTARHLAAAVAAYLIYQGVTR